MLNTEEWHNPAHGEWDWEKEGWFGETQMKYVQAELAQHLSVRHTFVLLHRPIWLYENSGWERIESALGDRAYTVFAGHYHNLTLHTRKDRRYFVLSATGGGLTPKEAPEAGAFDHYSIVTVDGEDVDVAIVEPGNIYPADISTATFKAKLANLLTFEPQFEIDETEVFSEGTLEISLKNILEKHLDIEIAFHPNENWQISPSGLVFQVRPGQVAHGSVALTARADALLPFPLYDYSVVYGGKQLRTGRNLFHPIDKSDMQVLKDWMLLGPFDLGVTSVPANEIPPNFFAAQLPKSEVGETYQEGEVVWQAHRSDKERINLDEVFGNPDWAFGYGVTHIKSPDARNVFAQIGWGCNLGRVFLNGVEIPTAAAPGPHLFRGWAHFELSLTSGWNSLVIQSGDYQGGWDYRM